MRKLKKYAAAGLTAVLTLTAVPIEQIGTVVLAAEPDSVVRLQPNIASVFNDTNGDGLGELEGWGTSLCWWANRVGYSEKMTNQAAELFFGDIGLDMNIGRYNVGGGDHVGDTKNVPANEKAQFYDLETEGFMPSYSGSKMQVNVNSNMKDVKYTASDADFGITKGTNVGNFKTIGWINKLGDAVGSGDNLHYKVSVKETGTYTVKLLMTLTGTNSRDVAIRVNATEQSAGRDYVVNSDTINKNRIASGNNNMLFLVTIPNVALNAGENKIDIAGKNDWTLDFVKMAVVKSGEEGVLPEEDEFLHSPHIKRSDSQVPGYASDVTKIDTEKHPFSWYEENYARADEQCGYAWNYDWNADANQMNVLKAAAKASGEEFIAEAFSNSPPYFMTNSGCTSGAVESGKDNLRADSVNAFAAYMADVIEHWNKEGMISFQSASPMNEPATDYWGANSVKQEGCHFDQGESQSRILIALQKELQEKEIDLVLSGTDETSIDTAITSYNKLSDEAKKVVERIDTHTYGGSNRAGLNALAEREEKGLWMSEVDGAYMSGTDAGEMGAALGLGQRIITDMNGLKSSAWVLWNAIDTNVDSDSEYKRENGGSDFNTLDDFYNTGSLNRGYWGVAVGDHNDENIVLTKKYYGYGQFTKYIRPGYTIISSGNNTLAAYDSEGKKAVIVAVNTAAEDQTWKFDLAGFSSMSDHITAIRTSGSLKNGENWADVTAGDEIQADKENKNFTALVKANSITTYVIEGVTYEASDEMEEIKVDRDMVSGSNPWNNDANHDASKAVDGNLSTFFDGLAGGYVTIDLGSEKEIRAVSYAPRSGYEYRCVGATIYGSQDGETWDALYTITAKPGTGTYTYVYADQFAAGNTYRYIKYATSKEGDGNTNCCNIAEFKLYTKAVDKEDGAILDKAVEKLDIPNKDDVRGNVTLPSELKDGVKVTWTTDREDIVDVNEKVSSIEGYGKIPAGVVIRPAKDTKVTVKAELTLGGASRTKEFVLNVKAAPKTIEESDYTDYFFAYFTGEGTANGEQIYFASSQDGLNWSELNNSEPTLVSTLGEQGLRDPFLIRSPEGDKFYLIATDLKISGNGDWNAAQNSGSQYLMVWESNDLVNWSEQRMVEVSASIGAGCTWAPEASYDPVTGEYVVYWASRVPSKDAKQRLYYAKTRDFYSFTEPQVYIDKDQSSIDTTMIENNGTYYRYTKNEGGQTNELGAKTKTIFIEKSNNVLGEFTPIASQSLNENQWVEGPTIFKLNEDDAKEDTWCLLIDNYGKGGYYPLVTNDLESGSFEKPVSYKMPSGARHGTPIRITKEEYQKITEQWGTPEEVMAVTHPGEIPQLPETVKVIGSSQEEKAVTWNLEGVSFDVLPYQFVTVKGTVEGSQIQATAKVQMIPENVEYMIDCNNTESTSWKNVASDSSVLLNTEAADQAKTEENSWGYVSSVGGSGDSVDMTGFSQSSVTNPYTGGWWAHGGRNISYQVTLPAGEHTVMLGCTGWWNMNRQMDVYYSVDGGEETKLCDLDAKRNEATYAQGVITLENEAVVTLSVKKAANDDSILSWISITGVPAEVPVETDKEWLGQLIDYAQSQKESAEYVNVIPAVKAAFEKAFAEAEAVFADAKATQAEVDAAYDKLLTMVHYLEFTGNSESLKILVDAAKGKNENLYTEESWAVFADALAKAEAVLANENALQAEIDVARNVLEAAMKALEKLPVDKSKLEKLIQKADKYTDKLTQYTEQTRTIFEAALANAKEVYANEDATQENVDAAYTALQNAIFGLRLIPNKDKLEDLINTAKKVDVAQYTAESAAAFQSALEKAELVFADGNATEEQVKAAEKELKKAQKNLVAKEDVKKEDNKVADNNGNSNTTKQPKTGDSDGAKTVVILLLLATAVIAVIVVSKKRRY